MKGIGITRSLLWIAWGLISEAPLSYAEAAPAPSTSLYDPSPQANRLHAALLMRYGSDGRWHGEDRVDPLYWATTTHLLVGDSHREALVALDEFLAAPDAITRLTALQRTLLQNDLWRLFNWAAGEEQVGRHSHEAFALMKRLGPAIKALALSKEEIKRLPDNLAQQVKSEENLGLANFDDPESGWVAIGRQDGRTTAAVHVQQSEGRSSFTIYLRLPKGREDTLEYLNTLNSAPEPLTYDKEKAGFEAWMGQPWIRKGLPVMPAGTEFALVRRLTTIDDKGNPEPTLLTQTIQIRRLSGEKSGQGEPVQEFKQFSLARRNLFSGAPSLNLIPQDASDFTHFLTHDIDQLADFRPPASNPQHIDNPLRFAVYSCFSCHRGFGGGTGIYTMNSYVQFFRMDSLAPPKLDPKLPSELRASDALYSLNRYQRGILMQWLRERPSK
jgi:hypothetical protein